MRATFGLVLLSILALNSGCVQFEPAYPVAAITFDEGMVGVWEYTDKEGAVHQFKIEERPLDVRNDHIDPKVLVRTETRQPVVNSAGVRGYTVSDPTPAAAKEPPLLGYLIRLDDRSFLFGAHPADVGVGPLGWALPLHFIGRAQRDGDELRFTMSRVFVAWVPRVKWVDEAPVPSDGEFLPAMNTEESGQIYITNSIDRVLAIYRRYGSEPGFWDETDTQTLRRVKSP